MLLVHAPERSGASLQKGFDAAVQGDYRVALREWRPLAENGNATAQIFLGLIYSNGQYAGRLYGHCTSFKFGNTVPLNTVAAMNWFQRAAKQHFVGAKFYVDDIGNFEIYRRLAAQGNAVAQSRLGSMYANGFENCSWCSIRPIPQDVVQAAIWYRRAAEQQDLPAQFILATMYHNGRGVRRDMVEAVRWYRSAAMAGEANAQFNLALLFAYGDGIERNFDEAEKWLYRTAKQGNMNAWLLLGALKLFGIALPHQYLSSYAVGRVQRSLAE